MQQTTDPDGITLSIARCPFCGQADDCRIFWGVIDQFLAWMHGIGTAHPFTPEVVLNESASQSHQIRLEFVPLTEPGFH